MAAIPLGHEVIIRAKSTCDWARLIATVRATSPGRGLQIRSEAMKIVIIGGSGLIGTKLASRLRQRGHEVTRRHRPRASMP